MNLYNFSLLFFAFCSFFVGLLIFLRRQDLIGRSYFIFSMAVTIWGISAAILLSENVSSELALFCGRLTNISALFIAITWYHFTLYFTASSIKKGVLSCLYVFAILIGLFSFTPWFVRSVEPTMNFRYFPRPGPFYHVYLTQYLIVVTLGFVELFKKMFSAAGVERRRLKGFIVATIIGFVGGSLTFFPAYEIMIPQYGLFFMPVYPFVMAYFMMRVNLFNLDQAAEAAHRDKLASIGILATSINHEVKNPLFIISGLAEGYLSKVKDGFLTDPKERLARTEEILSKTVEQSYRASEIIKRFAMFAKEGVKDEMKPEPLSMAQVLDDVLPLVHHELELGKIELVRDTPAGLPVITADRHHLTQILFNLIVNACQAMRNGGRLGIKAVPLANGVQIRIEDTGSGMVEEQLREIFQPFRTTKAEGTGLGLYITKLLIEKNGGRIAVESNLGKGTRFMLEFPAAINQRT